MPSSTITLKLSEAAKRRLRAQAKRENKSLNAYVLGKVAGAEVAREGRVDYRVQKAALQAKFGELDLWRSLDDAR